MDKNKLSKIIELHGKWLRSEPGGKMADLSGSNLSEADLRGADLSKADLRGADLRKADLRKADLSEAELRKADLSEAELRKADLRGANLRGADLRWANLSEANLSGADLSGANLIRANLSGADLRWANLSEANLRGADLRVANLSGADLGGILYSHETAFFALQCPEKGSYIAYKKAGSYIVELEIPDDALRSSATSRKCRASKAFVKEITSFDGSKRIGWILSDHDKDFLYKVGEMVEVPDFDTDRWNECSTGIHHFITRVEAILYG